LDLGCSDLSIYMLDESEHTGIVPVHILRTSNDDTVDVKEGKALPVYR
jgi:hypothetical protein